MNNPPDLELPPVFVWLKYIGNDVIKLPGIGELEPGQKFKLEESKALQSLEARPDIYEETEAPPVEVDVLKLPLNWQPPAFPAEEPMVLPADVTFPPDATASLPMPAPKGKTKPTFPTELSDILPEYPNE